jgi:hypothetical protein
MLQSNIECSNMMKYPFQASKRVLKPHSNCSKLLLSSLRCLKLLQFFSTAGSSYNKFSAVLRFFNPYLLAAAAILFFSCFELPPTPSCSNMYFLSCFEAPQYSVLPAATLSADLRFLNTRCSQLLQYFLSWFEAPQYSLLPAAPIPYQLVGGSSILS